VRATGLRRPIGCLKLQVIFRKRATNYRALLREMAYKDKASYGSSPPCTMSSFCMFLIENTMYNHFQATEWRRCIGCLELQISFCKRTTNFRALLRKMTSKDKVSCDSTPPCKYNDVWDDNVFWAAIFTILNGFLVCLIEITMHNSLESYQFTALNDTWHWMRFGSYQIANLNEKIGTNFLDNSYQFSMLNDTWKLPIYYVE